MVQVIAGASGFSFKEWKGIFYPEKIKATDMLAYYAEQLPTVEINSSYYAMPKPEMLEKWALNTPAEFRFSIKAPKAISHDARLKADVAAESLARLYTVLEALGDKRGPVLFQLPPSMKKDLPRLRDFLVLLPTAHQAAFEFRHDSWFCDEVYAALRERGAALCLNEREDHAPPPLVETTDWGYLRLRLEQYNEADLARWLERTAATRWSQAHAYFMHEPTAPAYAQTLMRLAG
jgi:uncharacterized protein YecE (DUF72 family)